MHAVCKAMTNGRGKNGKLSPVVAGEVGSNLIGKKRENRSPLGILLEDGLDRKGRACGRVREGGSAGRVI